MAATFGQVDRVASVNIVTNSADELRLRLFPEAGASLSVDRLLGEAAAQGLEVRSVNTEQGRLDEVFRTITTSA